MLHQDPRRENLKTLSQFLDSRYEVMGIRFGLDGLMGFVPVIGDFVTTLMSLYIISQAAALGCSTSTLIRMVINVAIESILDMIPLLGNFFDIFWKANNRNMVLLEYHLLNPGQARASSRIFLVVMSLTMIGLLFASGYLALSVFRQILTWLE